MTAHAEISVTLSMAVSLKQTGWSANGPCPATGCQLRDVSYGIRVSHASNLKAKVTQPPE